MSIYYPLQCNGVYVTSEYAVDEFLNKELIRNTKIECDELCKLLNEQQSKEK